MTEKQPETGAQEFVARASAALEERAAASRTSKQPAASSSTSPGSISAAKRRMTRSPSLGRARRRERAAPAEQVEEEQRTPGARGSAEPPAAPRLHSTRRERLADEIREAVPQPPCLPTSQTFQAALQKAQNCNNLTGSWELQELIVRFLGEQNIADIAQFRLPRTTVHGGARGREQRGAMASSDMPEEWSENTARRLEMHTARFWLRLFDAHAPHLLQEAADAGLELLCRGAGRCATCLARPI